MPRIICLLLLLFWARPVAATDNYTYKADEYAIISGGRSPDRHWSIAAHGDGELGYRNFDLYLMGEPAHEKLASLHTTDCLDTGPSSICAVWAPDSKHVVVLYRSDRHVLELQLFDVADGKVQPIKVPLLLDVVGMQHLKEGVHYEFLGRLYRVIWQQADRFILRESDTLEAAGPIFGAKLDPYVTLDRVGPAQTFAQFSAEATCEISSKGELRFLGVKALPQSSWSKGIGYSPHLLFDTKRGLHNTETTASSLDAQKDSK